MLGSLILFPLFLVGVIVSANYFLEHGKRLGIAIRLSPFAIGVFIFAFGTSLPEATISFFSTLQGAVALPIAQVIGSNIVNILLILGITSIILKRIVISKNLIDQELPILASVTVIFVFTILDGFLYPLEGLVLLLGFFAYLYFLFAGDEERKASKIVSDTEKGVIEKLQNIPASLGIFILSAIVLAVASSYTIGSLQDIIRVLGVPEEIIAFTVLALGTSLPELVVSVQAAFRRDTDLIIGNIVGSNVFNILFALSIPATFIGTLVLPPSFLLFGIISLVGVTSLFVISGISSRVSRWEGLFFLLLYILILTHTVSIL